MAGGGDGFSRIAGFLLSAPETKAFHLHSDQIGLGRGTAALSLHPSKPLAHADGISNLGPSTRVLQLTEQSTYK